MLGLESEEEGPVQAPPASRPKLSLGAAMINAPPAPGFVGPQEDLPGPWIDLFQEQHAGPTVYSGLFTSCCPGRDWALQHSSKATLTIDSTVELSTAEWARRLDAARQALQTRGAQATSLVVVLADTPHSSAACQWLVDALAPAASGVQSLTVRVEPVPAAASAVERASSFLLSAASVFTSISTLAVRNAFCVIPPPPQLPHLTHIDMQCDGQLPEACFAAIAARLGQLTSLRLNSYRPPTDWPLLFSPATTTHTLTHFSTDRQLTGQLLRLLVEHAPGLTQLGIHDIDPNMGVYSRRVWGVHSLCVGARFVSVAGLSKLPRTAHGGRVRVTALSLSDLVISDVAEQGIPTSVLLRLADWHFAALQVCVVPRQDPKPVEQAYSSDDESDDDPTPPPPESARALSITLAQLHDLQTAPDTLVTLQEWVWTDETARALATALPTLTHLKVNVDMRDQFTDVVLRTAVLMGPCVHRLSMYQLRTQDNRSPVSWPSPNTQLHVISLNTRDIPYLPHISGGGPVAIYASFLVLECITPAEVVQLREWLVRHPRSLLPSRGIHVDW